MSFPLIEPKPVPLWGQPVIFTMTQTEISIFREDVAWILLQVTGIAVLYFAVRKFMDEYQISQSRWEGPSRTETVTSIGLSGTSFSSLPLTICRSRIQLRSAVSMGKRSHVGAPLGHLWARSHLFMTLITEQLSRRASTSSVQSISSQWVGEFAIHCVWDRLLVLRDRKASRKQTSTISSI